MSKYGAINISMSCMSSGFKVQFVLQTVLKYEDLLMRSESKQKCKHFNLNITLINIFDHGQQVTKVPYSKEKQKNNILPRPISQFHPCPLLNLLPSKTQSEHCKTPKSTHHLESLGFFPPVFPPWFPVPAFFWITCTESFS